MADQQSDTAAVSTDEPMSGVEVVGVPRMPPEKKSRTLRDMAISMGLIAAVVLAVVWLYGGLDFAPGGPQDDGAVPTTNAVQKFAVADRVLPFRPAVPQGIPSSWHANSAAVSNPDTVAVGTPLTVRGGWLVNDSFIALVATNAKPEALLTAEFAQTPGVGHTTGTIDAGGAQWTVTSGVRQEVAWYRTAEDGITYLITGSAGEAEFRTLADSIAGA